MTVHELLREKGISLNQQQLQAASTFSKHMLLLAVPGSGKTTVILARIASMILEEKIPASKILTVTFNRESANDISSRLVSIFGQQLLGTPLISTIHSLCYRILNTYVHAKGTVMPSLLESGKPGIPSKSRLLAEVYRSITGELAGEDTLEELDNLLCRAKNSMMDREERKKTECVGICLEDAFVRYEKLKRTYGVMDFDDMQSFALTALKRFPSLLKWYQDQYPYLNVDEAQDTSRLQHEIIRLLAGKNGALFLVGDEDQSIYGFRGAYPQALLEFPKRYPDALVLKMEENYRSTGAIVTSAARMIAYNKMRYPKQMITHREQGLPLEIRKLDNLNEQYDEIVRILQETPQGDTIAVIYKNNVSALPLINALDKYRIPFYIREHRASFFKHFVVQDILTFFSLSFHPKDGDLFYSLYYKLGLYINRETALYVREHCNEYDDVFEVLLHSGQVEKSIRERIQFVRRKVDALRSMEPFSALECIEYDLGYAEYLEYRAKHGYREEVMTQRLATLKSIAQDYTTVEEFLNRLDELSGIIQQHSRTRDVSVTLTTMHSAKGLEFDRVILIDAYEGQLPSTQAIREHLEGNEEPMEEEARLFYVGVTRAKNQLTILCSEKLGEAQINPSRYIGRLLNDKSQADFENTEPLSAQGSLKKGTWVLHKRFGLGVIAGKKGSDVIRVKFQKHGERLLFEKAFSDTGLIRLAPEKPKG
ncbi:MAG TPA: ATP-dependent helicase [Firmicutes bacterium]|nr:ATP-dependent helicase [Bacillota bacterium]